MEDTKAILRAAREHLLRKEWREARDLLEPIRTDPTATKWLTQLDQIAPHEPIRDTTGIDIDQILNSAHILIQQQQWQEAREILLPVSSNPKAKLWLSRLDEPISSPSSPVAPRIDDDEKEQQDDQALADEGSTVASIVEFVSRYYWVIVALLVVAIVLIIVQARKPPVGHAIHDGGVCTCSVDDEKCALLVEAFLTSYSVPGPLDSWEYNIERVGQYPLIARTECIYPNGGTHIHNLYDVDGECWAIVTMVEWEVVAPSWYMDDQECAYLFSLVRR